MKSMVCTTTSLKGEASPPSFNGELIISIDHWLIVHGFSGRMHGPVDPTRGSND